MHISTLEISFFESLRKIIPSKKNALIPKNVKRFVAIPALEEKLPKETKMDINKIGTKIVINDGNSDFENLLTTLNPTKIVKIVPTI